VLGSLVFCANTSEAIHAPVPLPSLTLPIVVVAADAADATTSEMSPTAPVRQKGLLSIRFPSPCGRWLAAPYAVDSK